MSKLLSVSTVVLCISGALFACTYLWLNAFSKVSDLSVRNESILKIIKASVGWSLVFALLSCLLINDGAFYDGIDRAAKLYSTIAVTWLIVLLVCGLSMLAVFISKKEIRAEFPGSVKKLFSTALTGVIIGMLLSWLLG